MYQRKFALDALLAAKLYDPETGRGAAGPFVTWIEAHPTAGWPEIAGVLRTRFKAQKAPIAMAIWKSEDKVLRANLLRTLDDSRPDERALRNRFVSSARGDLDVPELLAAIETGGMSVVKLVARKKKLALELRREVDSRLLVPGVR